MLFPSQQVQGVNEHNSNNNSNHPPDSSSPPNMRKRSHVLRWSHSPQLQQPQPQKQSHRHSYSQVEGAASLLSQEENQPSSPSQSSLESPGPKSSPKSRTKSMNDTEL